ncbi:MAG: hypothetical protein V2I33_18800, partial [Kangiellaceae bacterium]|nr:hypothetical protein [Kangiellaceae bacterium]
MTLDHFQALLSQVQLPHAEEVFLVTMDASSLYTNIPTDRGIASVSQIFNDNPDPVRPDQAILELLELNLTCNDFVFNSKRYLQIKGTSMGKSFAPAYANIFMADWETRALNVSPHKPLFYKRYIDDIFMIFVGDARQLQQLIDHLCSFDRDIKLSAEFSRESVNFLDCRICLRMFEGRRVLDCSVFFKATDSRQLLHPRSFHPKHTFKGILKSQFLRYARRCTRQEDFEQACSSLKKVLMGQGYTRKLICEAKKAALTQIGFYTDRSWSFGFQICISENQHLCSLCSEFGSFGQICPGSPYTKLTYRISQKVTCQSRDAVYAILCRSCNCRCVYVGETGRAISTRIGEHLSDIRGSEDTPVARH